MSATSEPVINVSQQNIDNRHLSGMQQAIVAYLTSVGDPTRADGGELRIGHLPTTGDVIDALGLPRTKSTSASISRSLLRLERAGLVRSYMGQIAIRGRGCRYAISQTPTNQDPDATFMRSWHGKPMILSKRPSRRTVTGREDKGSSTK